MDFEAFKDFGIPIENTPGVFGAEVADLAMHYITGLARHTFAIDIEVKKGNWYKPIGLSLWASKALIVGMGDIGKNLAKRLQAHDVDVLFYDPYVPQLSVAPGLKKTNWPNGLSEVDFVIFTAPLTEETYHLFNEQALEYSKKGIKVIKGGAQDSDMHGVDGISGGTITSDGVSDMLDERLRMYLPYFSTLSQTDELDLVFNQLDSLVLVDNSNIN